MSTIPYTYGFCGCSDVLHVPDSLTRMVGEQVKHTHGSFMFGAEDADEGLGIKGGGVFACPERGGGKGKGGFQISLRLCAVETRLVGRRPAYWQLRNGRYAALLAGCIQSCQMSVRDWDGDCPVCCCVVEDG